MWLWIAICALVVFVWYCLRLRTMSILKRNGIPGPRPNLFTGTLFQMKDLSMVEKQRKLIENYGNIVGYYTGSRPNVLVADPELAKHIMIKNFDKFTDRTDFPRYQHPSPRANGSLFLARGQKWKHVRSLLTPAFTATKLKNMTPLVEESVNSFLKKVDEMSQTEEAFNIYELYQRLTAEVIITTAFGYKIDAQNDLNNEFLKAAREHLAEKVNKELFVLSTVFPILNILVQPLRSLHETICMALGVTPTGRLWSMSGKILQERMKDTNQFQWDDLLQAMINSKISKDDMSKIMFENLNGTVHERDSLSAGKQSNIQSAKGDKNDIYLTDNEIKINSIVLFGAGYETTSTALAFCAHFLVNYPEVQERIREEVVKLYESKGRLDYNTVNKLKYMEQVLNESMRIYPPVITGSSRECLADFRYKDIKIPKGTMVAIATYHLSHDKEFWTEPDKFDPDRFHDDFKTDRTSDYWMPFGSGPRNCIGMRLAYLEMKLTLAKLLLSYRLECVPQTELGQLQTSVKPFSLCPKNGVFVKAVKIRDVNANILSHRRKDSYVDNEM